MKARRIFTLLLLTFITAAGAAWWVVGWMEKRPLPPSGGLFFPREVLIPGPHFLQGDARWSLDTLGTSDETLGEVGCAVAAAAMVLGSYGIVTDPSSLNAFLTQDKDGYTPQGWIYWETAAKISPELLPQLLPHYEAAPSYFLMDWNLIHGNPVIIRLRYPNGVTHFMVVCGKSGFDYLVRDPGGRGVAGIYPLREFGAPIEALRFYKKPNLP